MSAALRILAIDQGSNECGLAYLEGEAVHFVTVFSPRSTLPWAERMDYIADQLTSLTAAKGLTPEVVAIEDAVFYVRSDPGDGMGRSANAKTVLTMGETRGYLKRVVRVLFPRARIMDIHPGLTKVAVGLSANARREDAKPHTRRIIAAALHRHPTDITEDEADAVAIGWAAARKLREERFTRLAWRSA